MDRNGVYQLPLLRKYLQFKSFTKRFITGIPCRYIPVRSVIVNLAGQGYKRLAKIYKLQVILRKGINHYLNITAVFL